MNRKDINNLNDMFMRVLTEAAGNPVSSNSSAAYDKLDQNLRENKFTKDSGETLVLFYTLNPGTGGNDILHNAAGPAVIFGDGGDGNEFYFINGEQVEPTSTEYKAANAEYRIGQRRKSSAPAEGEGGEAGEPTKQRGQSDYFSAFD